MAKTGPKTYAAYQVDGAIIPGARLPAPWDLEPEATSLWNAIVQRLPADWIVIETQPLLREYCRHSMYSNRFGREIVALQARIDGVKEEIAGIGQGFAEDGPGADLQKHLDKLTHDLHDLHRMHALETDKMITLAVKLRFTNQSRFVPEKAGSMARGSPPGLPPWVDWGSSAEPENLSGHDG